MKTKIGEVDVFVTTVYANKQSESYSCLLSDSLAVRGKGKANRRDNRAARYIVPTIAKLNKMPLKPARKDKDTFS